MQALDKQLTGGHDSMMERCGHRRQCTIASL